jgi:hypothetical protein
VKQSIQEERAPRKSKRAKTATKRFIEELNSMEMHEVYMVFRQAIKEPINLS